MTYYAFDLDNTLGDFTRLEYFLDILDYNKEIYNNFVNECVKRSGLGIFNPKMISILKSTNNKCIIYSNNPCINKLVFAKDYLEKLLDKKIFYNLLDWNHPLRVNEIVHGDPGNATKSWNVLQKGLFQAFGVLVEPDNVVFFDDLPHRDLIKVLGNNYVQVEEYNNSVAIKDLFECLKSAINTVGSEEANSTGFNVLALERFYTKLNKKINGGKRNSRRKTDGRKTSKKRKDLRKTNKRNKTF
jgi:hypothetical protein